MTRSRHNKMISGVCAGLAKQIGISAFWMRTLFVIAAAVVPGVSLIGMVAFYILMAVVLPWDEETARFKY